MGSLWESDVLPSKFDVMPLKYPNDNREETCIDIMHGHGVPDPYRELEDPKAEVTKAFVESQVQLTKSVLSTCDTKEKLRERITASYNYPKSSCPYRRGNKYLYTNNTGLQAQSVLYLQDKLDEDGEVLLDPNTWSEDGTISLALMKFSEDAAYLAYGQSASGSDWITIKVMRVADRVVQHDTLSWVKFSSLAWTHDHKGFFYNRYPEPTKNGLDDAGTETETNLFHELYYHFLGTDQAEDVLCWRDSKHAQWFSRAEVTDDGQYLVLSIEEGCDPVNRLYYCDLSTLPRGLQGLRHSKEQLPFAKLHGRISVQNARPSVTRSILRILRYLYCNMKFVGTTAVSALFTRVGANPDAVAPEAGGDGTLEALTSTYHFTIGSGKVSSIAVIITIIAGIIGVIGVFFTICGGIITIYKFFRKHQPKNTVHGVVGALVSSVRDLCEGGSRWKMSIEELELSATESTMRGFSYEGARSRPEDHLLNATGV